MGIFNMVTVWYFSVTVSQLSRSFLLDPFLVYDVSSSHKISNIFFLHVVLSLVVLRLNAGCGIY